MSGDDEVDEREQARRDARWERLQQRPAGSMSGPLAEVISVFAPAQKHAFEEQKADKIAPAPVRSGDDMGVDLEKGTFTLGRKKSQR